MPPTTRISACHSLRSGRGRRVAPFGELPKDGARKLTGAKRRAFQAQVTLDHLDGNVRQAESVFGWSPKTVELGLNQLRTGITCIGNFGLRGRPRVEDEHPQLVEDMLSLVEPQSQTDPKFQGRTSSLDRRERMGGGATSA
jgi:hypothetical protein